MLSVSMHLSYGIEGDLRMSIVYASYAFNIIIEAKGETTVLVT